MKIHLINIENGTAFNTPTSRNEDPNHQHSKRMSVSKKQVEARSSSVYTGPGSSNLKPFPSEDSDDTQDFPTTHSLQPQTSNTKSPYRPPPSPSADRRRRRSSSIISHVEPDTFEVENDQLMLPNMNATWVDQRGAWLIHIVIIVLLNFFYKLLPGVTYQWSWTLTNMTYLIGSYVMFHLIKGTPFDFNGGAFDNLTMWEQINDETLYTPSRKFLITVPIALFLICVQYCGNSWRLFVWNLVLTVLIGVVPKLPMTHRLRVYIPGITRPAQIS